MVCTPSLNNINIPAPGPGPSLPGLGLPFSIPKPPFPDIKLTEGVPEDIIDLVNRIFALFPPQVRKGNPERSHCCSGRLRVN